MRDKPARALALQMTENYFNNGVTQSIMGSSMLGRNLVPGMDSGIFGFPSAAAEPAPIAAMFWLMGE